MGPRRRQTADPSRRVAAALLMCLAGPLAAPPGTAPDLEAELAASRVPTAWLAEVYRTYDLTKPWKEARLQVRRLLDQGANREAIAIAYDYVVSRHASPDDHEYGLYLCLGGEYAWATQVYRDRLAANPDHETLDYANLGSLYLHYGRTEDAGKVLEEGLLRLPRPPCDVPNQAKLNERLGDVEARRGDREHARQHYALAVDAITAATVTRDAIVEATYRAALKAGLK